MSKKEAQKYIEGNPALEYLVKAELAGKYKCDTANASIDYGLAEIVKVFMDIIEAKKIKDYNAGKLEEFLEAELFTLLQKENTDKTEQELTELERECYYVSKFEGWLGYFEQFVKKPGSIRVRVSTDKNWKSVYESIKEGSFYEDYKKEYTERQHELNITEQEYENLIYKPDKNMQDKMMKTYIEHYDKINKDKIEMKKVVKRFIGQVLTEFMADYSEF